jgi:hypothetical protein
MVALIATLAIAQILEGEAEVGISGDSRDAGSGRRLHLVRRTRR